MERFREFFPSMLLRQREIGCQLTELRRPLLQLERLLVQSAFGSPSCADVGDKCDRSTSRRRGDVIHVHFNRER